MHRTNHLRHVRPPSSRAYPLPRRARALGDCLVAAPSTGEFDAARGKKATLRCDERRRDLEALRHVDPVIPERNRGQKTRDVELCDPGAFCMGDDRAGKFDFLRSQCEVV